MNAEASLIQAILADPDDDAPRLRFADWLEKRGDPRGEFIRVQCSLAQLPEDDPRCPELEDRETALLADHGEQWQEPIWKLVAGVPQNHCRVWFRRGFVEDMTADAGLFMTHAERLFQLLPLRRLCLTDANRQIAALTVPPALDGLAMLHLYASRYQAAILDSAQEAGLCILAVGFDSRSVGNLQLLDAPPYRYSIKSGLDFLHTLLASPRLCRLVKSIVPALPQSPEQARIVLRVFAIPLVNSETWALAHPLPEPEGNDEWRIIDSVVLLLFKDRQARARVRQMLPADFTCRGIG